MPSQKQEAALQSLVDQAQELDMGYGPNACPRCGKSEEGIAMKDIDLDALQALIDAAGNEEWKLEERSNDLRKSCNSIVTNSGETICDDEHYYPHAVDIERMRFIAAFNPQTASALITRLRKAEAANEWRAMVCAPKDGTEIEVLMFHPNRKYASEHEKKHWEQVVRAKWIDFNGGGWTWNGMFGEPVGWRHIAAPDSTDSAKQISEIR